VIQKNDQSMGKCGLTITNRTTAGT